MQEPCRFLATCSNGAWGGELKHPHLAQLPVRPYSALSALPSIGGVAAGQVGGLGLCWELCAQQERAEPRQRGARWPRAACLRLLSWVC